MDSVNLAHIKRLKNFIEDFQRSKPKPSKEISLGELAKLMNKIGFEGPVNKLGTARGFSHNLLQSNPMLKDGSFTVHLTNTKKSTIIYYDFKRFVLPHIEEVLDLLFENNLIIEEQTNEHF